MPATLLCWLNRFFIKKALYSFVVNLRYSYDFKLLREETNDYTLKIFFIYF